MYRPSYILAFAYCYGDVQDKAFKTYKWSGYKFSSAICVNAFDAMLWQLLASVFVPGYIINRTVEASTWSLTRMH